MTRKLTDEISLYDYTTKDLEKQLQSDSIKAKNLQKEVTNNLSKMGAKSVPTLPKMFEDLNK